MSDEFEDISSRLPNIDAVLAQRIAAKTTETPMVPKSSVDPYQLMVQKKQDAPIGVDPNTIRKWPEEDVKKLQDYCQKVGIVGFNPGRMPPMVALAMLKQQYGDYSDVPLEERVPEGYEKRGTPSNYGPNFPYSQAMAKKQILHG